MALLLGGRRPMGAPTLSPDAGRRGSGSVPLLVVQVIATYWPGLILFLPRLVFD